MNMLKLIPLALISLVPMRALAQTAPASIDALAPTELQQPSLSCAACRVTEGTGLAVFGASYGAMVLEFASLNHDAYSSNNQSWLPPEFVTAATLPMLLPVVGPLYSMAIDDEPSGKQLFALDAGVQLAGLAVAFAGERMEENWRVHVTAVPTPGGAQVAGAVAF